MENAPTLCNTAGALLVKKECQHDNVFVNSFLAKGMKGTDSRSNSDQCNTEGIVSLFCCGHMQLNFLFHWLHLYRVLKGPFFIFCIPVLKETVGKSSICNENAASVVTTLNTDKQMSNVTSKHASSSKDIKKTFINGTSSKISSKYDCVVNVVAITQRLTLRIDNMNLVFPQRFHLLHLLF